MKPVLRSMSSKKLWRPRKLWKASTEKMGIRQDQRTSDELREVRRFLDNSSLDLNGPECVLLGSFFKTP